MRKTSLILLFILLASPAFAQLTKQDSLSIAPLDTLDAAIVRDERTIRETATQTSIKKIEGAEIGRNFAVLGSPDLIKALQMLPGVSDGSELSSGLYVRGGDGSDNLYLLDGVPMYQISHMAGLFSSFNTDVIDDADFYKGGFPARFGGRLSSVVDVGVREGNFKEWHGNASLGLIDGHIQVEGPLIPGKTSINFGVRRTWTDIVKSVAMLFIKSERGQEMAGKTHYDFGDFNLKLVHKFSPVSKLSFSGYYGQDLLKAAVMVRQEDMKEDFIFDLKWGNILGTLAWDRQFSETFDMHAYAYYTNYSARMKIILEGSSVEVDEDGNKTTTALHMHENNNSRIYDLGIGANFYDKRFDGHHLRFGGSGVWHTYNPSRDELFKVEMNKISVLNTGDSQSKRYLGAEFGVYGEDEISLGRQWRINLGLSNALFVVDGKAYYRLEPRAAFKFMATDYLDVKGSFTTMNQFAHSVSASYADLPVDMWMPSTARVKPMSSNQFVLGSALKLPQNITVDVEAFYKTMDHIYEYAETNTMMPKINKWEDVFEEGIGRAYGLEFSFEYNTDKLNTAAYYTLSKTERLFKTFYYTWYPAKNDNRHKITLMASYRFNRKFELYGAWNYHTGNKFTGKSGVIWDGSTDRGYDLYESPNNYSLPPYHRLDVGFNWHKKTRHGLDATTTFSVYNAYNHVNPMIGMIEEDNGKMVGVAYGLIPILPTLSYALKF